MDTLFSPIREFFRKGDPILLAFCLLASGYGLVLVYSATRYLHSNRYVIVQAAAILIGVVAYAVMTFVDFHTLVEKSWKLFLVFNVCFVMLVRSPLGVELLGNRNWIKIPGIPLTIQPDEIVKVTFILLLAWQMSRMHEKELDISSMPCVFQLAAHTLFLVAVVAWACGDMGMCVIYICIFAVMAWAAGVKLRWFVGVGSLTAISTAVLWIFVLPKTSLWDNYRIMRFRVVLDHSLDPMNKGYQQTRALLAIGSGGLMGQGYLNGTQTQASYSPALPIRESDFIFAVCGEEFGFVGCVLLLGLLCLIILRCIWIARHADSPFSAYVAIGAAGMLIAQIGFNVGMCLYVAPVMGLTLPFISNGGSSIVTMYAAMGVVSSVKGQTLPSWLRDRNQL